MNLTRILDEAAASLGQNTALIADERRCTYGELNRAVNAFSRNLLGLGVKSEDRVAIMLPNCPEFVIAYFASVKIGAVALTISSYATAYELLHILENSGAKVLITQGGLAKRYEEIRLNLPLVEQLIVVNGPGGGLSFEELPVDSAPLAPVPREKDDPAVMIYTAGLTGRPLGAVLTHENLLTQSRLVREVIGGSEADRALALIPLFHSFGAAANLLGAIGAGAGIVLMERFTLEGIFAALERERVTYLAAVPRLFIGMVLKEETAKYDLSSLRVCVTGGAAMPPDFIPLFERKFGVPLLEGYGLTEASPVCSVARPGMPQKLGSIGVPIPGVEARIVDDRGKELPPDETGELVVRGANVMKGYFRDEAATEEVIREGWLHTGDLGRIDREGYIFLTGRKKRMIITSGFNVYPREVEAVLELHGAVQESRAVGKNDLLRGEVVRALVVARCGVSIDEKEILRHCRTYLSAYKVPREVEFVEALPPL